MSQSGGLESGIVGTTPSSTVWEWGPGQCPNPCSYYLWQERKLFLPFISFSTLESRPCTSSGQHSRADPVGRAVSEPGQGVSTGESAPLLIRHAAAWLRKRCCPCPSPLMEGGRGGHWVLRVDEISSSSLPTPAFRRVAPAPLLGNKLELALMVSVWVSWP